MTTAKTVQEILVPLTDYPHMPFWFSVRQAITMLELAADEVAERPPRMVLVFDEKYQLLGTLGLEEILRGLEPRYLDAVSHAQGYVAPSEELAVLWADSDACREASSRQVQEVMRPIKSTVSLGDSVTRAAVAMLADGAGVVPVMDGLKVAGVVRLEDVYQAITSSVMNG